MTFKPRLGTLLVVISLAIVNCSQAQRGKQRFCLEPCSCHGDRISCRDTDLEEVPPFVTINGAHIVDLSKNNILAVDSKSLAWGGTIQLQFLYLSGNAIVYVESGAFDDLLNLEHVDLSNNELQFVPANIVAENTRIRELNLAQNMFVHEIPLLTSDSLQILDLSWNKLDTILPETFTNLPKLKRLELQSNNFQYISTETFLMLPNLMHIDLNLNMWPCNCSSQMLFEYVTTRGLFNTTAPIICQQIDLSTNEIYLQDAGSNYCYNNTVANASVLLLGNDPTIVIENNTQIHAVANTNSTIMTAIDPLIVITDDDDDDDDDVLTLSSDVNDIKDNKDIYSIKTEYHFRYSMFNILSLMVFIVLIIFITKLLMMCLTIYKSLSDRNKTEECLLKKGTQTQIA